MCKCELGFTAKDNPSAYKLYEGLIGAGVARADMDIGYNVTNYAGIHCPKADDRSCVKSAGDDVISPEEVFEYALGDYEKYRGIIEGVIQRPIPWVLDDLNPATTFDADIRKRVQETINCLKGILSKNGVKEGTEAYKENLAVGLFWFVTSPDKEALKKALEGGYKDEKTNARRQAVLGSMRAELESNGLGDFWGYLVRNGGLRVEGDYSSEFTALEALERRQGECTEKSKILFGIFRMAGLDPVFVLEEKNKLIEDSSSNPLTRYFVDELNSIPPGMTHLCIGHVFAGRLRLLDPSFFNSNAVYKAYHLLSLRQYLSSDITNNGVVWSKKGERDKAIADYSKAVEIDPRNYMAYTNRGNVWKDKGEWDKAIAAFSKALSSNPQGAEAYYGRGVCEREKREYDKSLADFSSAVKNDSKHLGGYLNLGLVHTIMSRYGEAVSNFAEAFRLDGGDFNGSFNYLPDYLMSHWKKENGMSGLLSAFDKDGGGVDLARVTAGFILSYALWRAGHKDTARGEFGNLSAAISFKNPPSPIIGKFFKQMLDAMPPDMKEYPDVKRGVDSLLEKTQGS